MKKRLLTMVLVLLGFVTLRAQSNDEVVLQVEGQNITKTEFMKMYNKSTVSGNTELDREDLKDYLDLYINYRLKLLQAKQEGLDTARAYKEEVDGYRKQIIAPYLNDESVTDSLVKEAYEREKEFVRASHILIAIPANATPADTLAAYKKAMMIRIKALSGEDFSALAEEYSEDPSAKDRESPKDQKTIKGNRGDLGYFTSMTMVYSFESACYKMEKGDVSMPIRTKFGYHIIKLTDRIPALFSTCNIKHVWIDAKNHNDEEAMALIKEAYSHVEEWKIDSVAKAYSEDDYSAKNNGWLMNQKPNSVPAEYVECMKTMKEGDLSPILHTRYGWHFFKLMNIHPLQDFEGRKAQIMQRVGKDERGFKSVESFINKSKEYYGFSENKKNYEELVPLITDSIFSGTWQMPENYTGDKVVFTIGDSSFSQSDILKYIYVMQRRQTPEYIPLFMEKIYNAITANKVYEYADSKLEDRYPELRETMNTFREGVLIFAITDREVWNKGLNDSIGLQEYYNLHKSEYIWQDRADVTIWNIGKSIDLKKAEKIIAKNAKKGISNEDTRQTLLKKFKITENPDKFFTYTWGRYEKGANKNVDRLIWNSEVSKNRSQTNLTLSDTSMMTNKNNVLVLKGFVLPEIKTLEECKGMVTSKYQELLESKWIESLRKTYKYKVNYDVFNSIK